MAVPAVPVPAAVVPAGLVLILQFLSHLFLSWRRAWASG
jgi:hypothetical protein